MARIGKTVDISNTAIETVSDCIVEGMQENGIVNVNWNYNKTNKTINIYGEDVDLTTLKIFANSKGLVFDVIGDAPAESVPDVEPPPTQDEIDALAFFKTAFVTAMTNERQRIIDLIETEYDLINTTPIAFTMRTDIKWFRGTL